MVDTDAAINILNKQKSINTGWQSKMVQDKTILKGFPGAADKSTGLLRVDIMLEDTSVTVAIHVVKNTTTLISKNTIAHMGFLVNPMHNCL